VLDSRPKYKKISGSSTAVSLFVGIIYAKDVEWMTSAMDI